MSGLGHFPKTQCLRRASALHLEQTYPDCSDGFWEFRVTRLHELNPCTPFTPGLASRGHRRKAGRGVPGRYPGLIINLLPCHLKSHLASIAFPA
jgi:hypothetical protein